MRLLPTPPSKAAVRAFALTAVFLLSTWGGYTAYGATEHHFNCGKSKDLMATAMHNGYAYLATAILDPSLVLQFYINLKTGEWMEMGIDKDDNSCVLLHGSDWVFAVVKGI